MQRNHFLQEACFGLYNILDRLIGLRVWKEPDEITGVTGLYRDADFTFGLESGNARAVSGARIDDDEGPLERVDRHGFWRDNAGQHIVDRAGKIVAVHHQLGLHAEHIGRLLGHVALVLISALAHDVCVEDAALPGIRQIFGRRSQ